MEWMKYTINTTEEAEDLVCSMLNDFGIMNVDAENNIVEFEESYDVRGLSFFNSVSMITQPRCLSIRKFPRMIPSSMRMRS